MPWRDVGGADDSRSRGKAPKSPARGGRLPQLRVSRTVASAGTPLYRQVYQQLRERIESGSLPSGARLPSSRALTRTLGVARNTVDGALALLTAEGWIVRRVGAGTFVADRPAD